MTRADAAAPPRRRAMTRADADATLRRRPCDSAYPLRPWVARPSMKYR